MGIPITVSNISTQWCNSFFAVYFTVNEPSDTYYTLDGTDPKTSITRLQYISPFILQDETYPIVAKGFWSSNAFNFTVNGPVSFIANILTSELNVFDSSIYTVGDIVNVSGFALPDPLVVGTNYYVIITSPTTIQLALTYDDAILNNFITLISTGVGGQLETSILNVDIPANVFVCDSITDLLIGNNSYNTGDIVTLTGGSLPTPLQENIYYFVIHISNTSIKLAASYTDALANIPIDLTTGGAATASEILFIRDMPINFISDLGDDILYLNLSLDIYTTGDIITVSGNSLPSPLNTSTNYYAIRISESSLKLALTFDDAKANIAIHLTNNGSGTVRSYSITTVSGAGKPVIPSNYATLADLIIGENLSISDIFNTADGSDVTSGELTTAKAASLNADDAFTVDTLSTVLFDDSLPSVLSETTNYYIIRLSDTQIRLSISQENARDINFVDIASTGIGRLITSIITISNDNNYFTGDIVTVSGPSIPVPLVSGTQYYVIRLSSTTIRLATTFANAVANNFIDFTFAGTGDITITGLRIRYYSISHSTSEINDVQTEYVKIDSHSPITTVNTNIVPDGSNNWYLTSPIISLSATDNVSGLKQIFYSWDGQPFQEYTSLFITIPNIGVHYLQAYSVDIAGNKEDALTQVFKYDNIVPSTEILIPLTVSHEPVTITFLTTDSASDNTTTYYTIDGTTPTINSKSGSSFEIKDSGLYVVKFFSVDDAGNIESVKQSDPFRIELGETTLQVILTESFPINGKHGWYRSSPDIGVVTNKPNLINTLQYKIAPNSKPTTATYTSTVQITSPIDLFNGSLISLEIDQSGQPLTIDIRGVDSRNTSIQDIIDGINNAIGTVIATQTGVDGLAGTGYITVTSPAAATGVATSEIKFVNPGKFDATLTVFGLDFDLQPEYTFTETYLYQTYTNLFTLPSDNIWLVSAKAVTDTETAITQKIYYLDSTNPETSISIFPGSINNYYTQQQQITLTATDNISGVDKIIYQMDKDPTIRYYTGPIQLPFVLASRTITFVYFSSDIAGNIESPHEIILNFDIAPPITSINSVSTNYINDFTDIDRIQDTDEETDEKWQNNYGPIGDHIQDAGFIVPSRYDILCTLAPVVDYNDVTRQYEITSLMTPSLRQTLQYFRTWTELDAYLATLNLNYTHIAFTADSLTDILTVSSNIYQTGYVVNVIGSSLPAPLTESTNYYAIRLSATQLQLAATYADAIAIVPTPIDLTSSGNGDLVRVTPEATIFNSHAPTLFTVSIIIDDTLDLSEPNYKYATGDAVKLTGLSLPEPLVRNQTYYIIKLSPIAIKLAYSYANAIANNAIELASLGSGNIITDFRLYLLPTDDLSVTVTELPIDRDVVNNILTVSGIIDSIVTVFNDTTSQYLTVDYFNDNKIYILEPFGVSDNILVNYTYSRITSTDYIVTYSADDINFTTRSGSGLIVILADSGFYNLQYRSTDIAGNVEPFETYPAKIAIINQRPVIITDIVDSLHTNNPLSPNSDGWYINGTSPEIKVTFEDQLHYVFKESSFVVSINKSVIPSLYANLTQLTTTENLLISYFPQTSFVASAATDILTVPVNTYETGDVVEIIAPIFPDLLPTPLTTMTAYYAIYVSSTELKLALTYNDAVNNIFIDLTTDGSGSLNNANRFFSGDGTDTGDGALAAAKGSSIVQGDTFFVTSSSTVVYLETISISGAYIVTFEAFRVDPFIEQMISVSSIVNTIHGGIYSSITLDINPSRFFAATNVALLGNDTFEIDYIFTTSQDNVTPLSKQIDIIPHSTSTVSYVDDFYNQLSPHLFFNGVSYTYNFEGQHTAFVAIIDKNNNLTIESTITQLVGFNNIIKLDTFIPVTTDDTSSIIGWNPAPGHTGWVSSAIVTLSATDFNTPNNSGIKSITYNIHGLVPDVVVTSPTPVDIFDASIILDISGQYTIKYFAQDYAGNIELVQTATDIVQIDNIAPITSVVVSPPNGLENWYVTNPNISLTAVDAHSGVNAIYYKWDNSIFFMVYTGVFLIPSEGIHTLYFFSVDNVGNTEQIKSYVFKLDVNPPTTIDNISGQWTNNPVITFTAIDNVSGAKRTYYEIRLSSIPVPDPTLLSPYTETFTITVPLSGIYHIKYFSVDVAGNVESIKVG